MNTHEHYTVHAWTDADQLYDDAVSFGTLEEAVAYEDSIDHDTMSTCIMVPCPAHKQGAHFYDEPCDGEA